MKPKIYFIILSLLIHLACFSQTTKVSLQVIDGIQDKLLKTRIEQNSSALLTKLNEACLKNMDELQLDDKIVTPEGIEKIKDLWKEGHFQCAKKQISEIVVQKGDLYQIRNIPVIYGDSDRFDVVIEYCSDGKISDLYIALEAHQYKSVLDATSVIDRTRREIILGFLENLRTAYVKKDIDYIEKLYSEKALIITGKIIKSENISTDNYKHSLTKNQIEYQVQTKSEYINKLKNVFSNIKYLKLDFKDIAVVKHRKYPNFYGIQLNQIWDASNYKDNGLLFLLVQFKDNEDPIIWVRTWQDAEKTPANEIFDLHNFKISDSKIK
jgi:DNA-binding protein YbaB